MEGVLISVNAERGFATARVYGSGKLVFVPFRNVMKGVPAEGSRIFFEIDDQQKRKPGKLAVAAGVVVESDESDTRGERSQKRKSDRQVIAEA